MRLKQLFLVLVSTTFLFSCSHKKATNPAATTQPLIEAAKVQLVAVAPPLTETFEQGSKKVYTNGTVVFTLGRWALDDALIGATTADRKTGDRSIRIRRNGKLGMNFNTSNGASVVTVKHAVYSNDSASQWQLWISGDNGNTYTQVDSTINSSDTTLQVATFTLNRQGSLRIEIRKTSGGNNRINIDDITINSYGDNAAAGTVSITDNTNLMLGNPSKATTDITNGDNYLIDRTYYTESYNNTQGKPNWVSWYLGSSSLGNIGRKDTFRPDLALPPGFYSVLNTSYAGSGFDRGHNCPSADRTNSTAANSATFLMTNMMPQAPNNNEHTWASLENYERTLVKAGNELYIICGSYGAGGTGSKGFATTIGKGHITVPSNTWKIIVVLPNGNNDLVRIDNSTRIIAVNMPNDNGLSPDWHSYLTTVDAIETATGYDLLSNIPATVQLIVEARMDSGI